VEEVMAEAVEKAEEQAEEELVAEQQAVLSVTDSGVGIDRDFLQRLFRPFEQAEQDLSRAQGGLGLGLALSAHIIELHQGTIEAASLGRGNGSKFTVRLPVPKRLGETKPLRATTLAPGNSLRFLIIEDNQDAAELLALLLEGKGHQVSFALTGKAGLSRAAELLPDVILCDLGLPELTGFDVARHLKAQEDTRHISLIALSGYGREQDKRESLRAGFDAHLTKPTDPTRILNTSRALLSRRAPRQCTKSSA
jgi:two-component system CheB/CheR fusion protein